MATMTVRTLTDRLAAAFGDELRAVVLYGSAVGRAESAGGTANILVLLRSLKAEALRAAGPAVHEWAASGQRAPLILTESEWRSSRDVFAMEHADIAERHQLLAGTFPAEPAPAVEDLRHQLEYEAMGALIHLRQGVLASHGDAARELVLLAVSKSTVFTLFRTLLRVVGRPVPPDTEAMLRAAAELAGVDPAPFVRVAAHVEGTQAIPPAEARALLVAYHDGVKRLVAYVDAMVHPDAPAID